MPWNYFGNEPAVRYLMGHVDPQKTRHAYLITGPEGVGRRTLALNFFKALNCQNAAEPGGFCGTCVTCRQIDSEAYPDLSIIRPEPGRELKIDQVRALQQSLALAPYQSRYRGVLIEDFHRATQGASNALLKSLEEPPSRALIILLADAAENLLETITSRCDVIRLRPSNVKEVEALLQEKLQLEADQAKTFAHLSSGRVGAAMSLATDPQLQGQQQYALDLLQEWLPARKRDRLAALEKLLRKKNSPRELAADLLPAWLSFWRDVLITASGAEVPLVNLSFEQQIKQTASKVPMPEIRHVLSLVEKAFGQIDGYINARLLLENLLLQFPQIEKK